MSDDLHVPAPTPTEPLAERSLRMKIKTTRDRLIHEAATRIIHFGRRNPKLRQAGYWLYGTATRYLPRGKEVVKLGEVGPGVYRGAQPSLRAFATLKELGVDTVINLRPECDYEGPYVQKLGMRYMYMPLPALDAPTIAVTVEFLRAVTDPEHGVVFFHCFHGVDRTGTMAACLRIARDGWSVEAALEEMRAYKVHEQGQRAKVAFLAEFAAWWQAQPVALQREILHLPPIEADLAAEPARAWWQRAGDWVNTHARRWFKRDA